MEEAELILKITIVLNSGNVNIGSIIGLCDLYNKSKTNELKIVIEAANKLNEDYVFRLDEWEKHNKGLQASIEDKDEKLATYRIAVEEYEKKIKNLKDKLEVATNALLESKDWDEDSEDIWEDQGYRAISALNTIND